MAEPEIARMGPHAAKILPGRAVVGANGRPL